AAATPDGRADGAGTGAPGALLTPRFLATATNFRAGFLRTATLAGRRHIRGYYLMHQIFVVLTGKGRVRDGYLFIRATVTGLGNIQFHCSPLSGILDLDRGANDHVATGSPGNCTLDQQQVALGVDADDLQRLHGHLLGPHVAGHLLALEYAARGLVLTNG